MPVQWLSWPKDSHFPLDCQRACYQSTKEPYMVSLIPGMGHSHQAGWRPADSYAFAKSVVETGKPWANYEDIDVADGQLSVKFSSTKPLDKATLIYTLETGFTGDREWLSQAAQLQNKGDQWIVTSKLPKGTVGWFINVNSGKLTVSSDYHGK